MQTTSQSKQDRLTGRASYLFEPTQQKNNCLTKCVHDASHEWRSKYDYIAEFSQIAPTIPEMASNFNETLNLIAPLTQKHDVATFENNEPGSVS